MDWRIGNRLPLLMEPIKVWMMDDSVRTVRHVRAPMGLTLHFTDCNHPAQNVVCDVDRVQAWSLAAPAVDG